jgi:hypothetical protein
MVPILLILCRLTVGPAVGCIRDLFAKVKAINAKHGKFDLVLCAGDFFGPLKGGGDEDGEDETFQLLSGKLEGQLRSVSHIPAHICIPCSPNRMLHHARGTSSTAVGS